MNIWKLMDKIKSLNQLQKKIYYQKKKLKKYWNQSSIKRRDENIKKFQFLKQLKKMKKKQKIK